MKKFIQFGFVQAIFLGLVLRFGVSADKDSIDFDELKFTQLWGYTSCLQFKQEVHDQVECRYEDKPSIWSIHGIWPTLSGSSGPNFCTKVTFDETAIEPIESDLNLYWYEISSKKDPTEFWSHEWIKHGSCALQLTDFKTEYKYFEGGLLLRNKFDLYSILKDGGIIPQVSAEGYKLADIKGVIKAALGVDAYLQCYELKVHGTPEYHLLAVEICLDRSLNLISCSTSRHVELTGVTACPEGDKHLIQYSDKYLKYAKTDEL